MKNSVYFSTPSGKIRYAEFGWIESISQINIADIMRYYLIYVTNVVYPDTGEIDERTVIFLADSDCSVTYCGKRYEFGNLARLYMVVENENTRAVLESL